MLDRAEDELWLDVMRLRSEGRTIPDIAAQLSVPIEDVAFILIVMVEYL